jgi:hypothetical protein
MFRAWIEARDPRLAGRVSPKVAPPGRPDPYLVYALSNPDRVTHLRGHSDSAQSGLTGGTLELQVWSRDYELGAAIAHRLAGHPNDPGGLDGFRGGMAHPAVAGFPAHGLNLSPVLLADADEYVEVDEAGHETGWHCQRSEYRFHYQEVR